MLKARRLTAHRAAELSLNGLAKLSFYEFFLLLAFGNWFGGKFEQLTVHLSRLVYITAVQLETGFAIF